MNENKNPDLHIVNSEGTHENPEENRDLKGKQEREWIRRKENEKRSRKIVIIKKSSITVMILLILLFAGAAYIKYKTYDSMEITDTYAAKSDKKSHYVRMGNGILKYSREGAEFILKGKEEWNVSYQMKKPGAEIKKGTAVIADHTGKEIYIFKEEGLVGKIHTDVPVEKAVVSSQGIVGAVLNDDAETKIVCYDIKGNLLAEHQISLSSTGYPLDIDISDDGKHLLVSYLKINGSDVLNDIVYYDFGIKKGEEEQKVKVQKDSYKNKIIPSVFFMENNTAAVVTDDGMIFYEGEKNPSVTKKIKFNDEIKSVFHDEKYVGVILKKKSRAEVQLFNKKGKNVLTEEIKREYQEAKIEDDRIMLYDGKHCEIIMKSGVHKFEGTFEKNILGIFAESSTDKYIVATPEGINEVCLTK